MSVGWKASPYAEQQALKRLYAEKGGNLPGICAEGHRIRGSNVRHHRGRNYCRKCVESLRIVLEPMQPPPGPQSVYFIADEHGNVKIGYASSVGWRLANLQTANASELTLLVEIPDGGPKLERELHKRFSEHRVRGEWFRLAPEILDYIETVKQEQSPKPKSGRPKKVPEYVRIQQELARAQQELT